MKRIEDFEREYKLFETKTDFIKNEDDFKTLLEVSIDDLEEEYQEFYKELDDNNRRKMGEKILNFVTFMRQDVVEFYEENQEIIEKQISLTEFYYELYNRMMSVVSSENVLELVKLFDFAAQYYIKQIDYYDYSSEQLESLLSGIQMFHSKYEDNDEAIRKFFDLKLSKLEEKTSSYQYRK